MKENKFLKNILQETITAIRGPANSKIDFYLEQGILAIKESPIIVNAKQIAGELQNNLEQTDINSVEQLIQIREQLGKPVRGKVAAGAAHVVMEIEESEKYIQKEIEDILEDIHNNKLRTTY